MFKKLQGVFSVMLTIAAFVALGNAAAYAWNISGRVTMASGAGVAGVSCYVYPPFPYSGAPLTSAVTDASGYYTLTGLQNGNYEVNIQKINSSGYSQYDNTPVSPSITISNSDAVQNFTVGYNIGGAVKTADGQYLFGVSFSYTGTLSGSVSHNGLVYAVAACSPCYNYQVGLLTNGVYTITPSLAGYTFSPPSITVTVSDPASPWILGNDFTATLNGMAAPAAQSSFSYQAAEKASQSDNPANAKPVGVGKIASGGNTVGLNVALAAFTAPVDIYFGVVLPSDPNNVYLLKPDNSFQPLSAGLTVWKYNTTGPVNESLFGELPASSLPKGTYTLYLAVTPTGSLSSYYLWTTDFVVNY